jgi:hypothetical protein
MRCQHANKLISLALDQPLSEYDRQALASHLQQCSECARHEAILTRGREILQKTVVEPPENFEWKVQLGIQKALRAGARQELPRRSHRFWLPLGVSATVATALVVVVGSLWIGGATVSDLQDDTPQMAQAEVSPDLEDAEAVPLPRLPIAGRPGFAQLVSSTSSPQPVSSNPFAGRFDQIMFNDDDPYVLHSRIDRLQMEVLRLQRENATLRMQLGSRHSASNEIDTHLRVKTVRDQ